MRGGGDGSLGGGSDSLGKNFRIPPFDLEGPSSLDSSRSSSEGTGDNEDKDERSEESSSVGIVGLLQVKGFRWCGGVKSRLVVS